MSLDAGASSAIDSFLATAPADHVTLTALRQFAPHMTVTRCDAVDVRDETPFREYALCNLYLIDGRDHCWKITGDPAAATGLVLAPKGGDV